MDWHTFTNAPHTRTFEFGCRLDSLPTEWERELAAVWRLEADVNNGAYLQFLGNWGRETYVYALQALKKMGAARMAKIVEQCQSLVDEHAPREGMRFQELRDALPREIVDRIYDLSYEFMAYPDNVTELGVRHYAQFVKR